MFWRVYIYRPETQTTIVKSINIPNTTQADVRSVYAVAGKKFNTEEEYMLALPDRSKVK